MKPISLRGGLKHVLLFLCKDKNLPFPHTVFHMSIPKASDSKHRA